MSPLWMAKDLSVIIMDHCIEVKVFILWGKMFCAIIVMIPPILFGENTHTHTHNQPFDIKIQCIEVGVFIFRKQVLKLFKGFSEID